MKFATAIRPFTGGLSHPARGAWIEIEVPPIEGNVFVSHPARGAWIEIVFTELKSSAPVVAPRKGCVD